MIGSWLPRPALRIVMTTAFGNLSAPPRTCTTLYNVASLDPLHAERLLKHVDPEMSMSIEMINGQHFELNWLEDRFWTANRSIGSRWWESIRSTFRQKLPWTAIVSSLVRQGSPSRSGYASPGMRPPSRTL